MQIEDSPPPRDWEREVLGRIRDRVENADVDADVDAGWESVAIERLRAHFGLDA